MKELKELHLSFSQLPVFTYWYKNFPFVNVHYSVFAKNPISSGTDSFNFPSSIFCAHQLLFCSCSLRLVSNWGMTINEMQASNSCFPWSFILKGKRIMLMWTALPQASTLVWEIRYERPFLSCLIFCEGSLIRKRNLSEIYSFAPPLHGEQRLSDQRRSVFFLGFEGFFLFLFWFGLSFLLFCVCVWFLLLLLFCFYFWVWFFFFCSLYL